MKKTIMILAIIFSGILMQAQTLTDIANQYLGQSYTEHKFKDPKPLLIKTDYGNLTFKYRVADYHIHKVIVRVANENLLYDSILSAQDYHAKKTGSIWTDFIFEYIPVETKTFTNIEDAMLYKAKFENSKIKTYQEVQIYKHPKKEKYVVGYLRKGSTKVLYASDSGKPIITNNWLIL